MLALKRQRTRPQNRLDHNRIKLDHTSKIQIRPKKIYIKRKFLKCHLSDFNALQDLNKIFTLYYSTIVRIVFCFSNTLFPVQVTIYAIIMIIKVIQSTLQHLPQFTIIDYSVLQQECLTGPCHTGLIATFPGPMDGLKA